MLLLHVDPLLESLNEAHTCDLKPLLTAAATTEEVVAWTKYPEAAASALLVFARDEYLIEVVVVQRMTHSRLLLHTGTGEVTRVHVHCRHVVSLVA